MADVRSTVTTPIASDFAIGAAVDNVGTPIVVDRVAGTAYILDSTDTVTAIGGGGGGGAPVGASYLTLGLNGVLTAERVMTAGTAILFADTGANGTLTISVNTLDTVPAPVASVQFNQQQALQFRFENRTSDPGAPLAGQTWLRTDL
ncbi:hypothetical protein UFOVP1165_63 [uncultured Caudovirales phage]|uniref:Uncharacterized protein n=1 Tax=uncultured Caudovirales phage TaxID=2100421 RepID=A0A6J5QUE7_9CAUD|nr:hypothetical protein UFOVP1165_63 [uncultured Caudovirales phage]